MFMILNENRIAKTLILIGPVLRQADSDNMETLIDKQMTAGSRDLFLMLII
jgi:hypothetical protein